ncbi:MAG: sigma-54 dependent transcriptional regulator [Phycisphaerae bacterium]
MAHICVVDDSGLMRTSVETTLARADHRVTSFAGAREALEAIRRTRFDLVLTDLKMPEMDGMALIRALRQARCDVPVIVMTAYGTVPDAVEAMKLGAFDFVQKPFEAQSLEIQVERVLTAQRLRAENEALRTSLADLRKDRRMVGDSGAMQQVRRKIEQYSASDATVLISGESGTGKELVAAAIHEMSPRRERPMLCLNCAALTPQLLESEMFGHERGAFTGADRLRKGRFELADSGTLLLDEISEMAQPLQSKLLRVLQEGEFERIGSSVTQQADVRVIATTNRVLEEWVAKKRFRADLYYRLHVLPLHLPPLRERREDIPLIVNHFMTLLKRVNKSSVGRANPLKVEPGAMQALCEYDWPGNVRELENVCQRAVATVSADAIVRADVEQWLGGWKTNGLQSVGLAEDSDVLSKLRPGRMLEDMERRLIERTLRRFNGHRVKSAQALGMGVRTLGLKLKQWREQDGVGVAGSRSVETART